MSAQMAAQIMDNGKLLQHQQSIGIKNNGTQRISNLEIYMKDTQQQQNNSLGKPIIHSLTL